MKSKKKTDSNKKNNNKSLTHNLIVLIIIVAPFLFTLVWSLTNRWPWPKLIPPKFSSYGWDSFFNSSDYKLIGASILLSLAVTFLTLLISIPTSKALSYNFKFKKLFK